MIAIEDSEKIMERLKNSNVHEFWAQGLKYRMGEKSNMLAMEESEKSWKCSRILSSSTLVYRINV